jgi:molybdenum cofactor cytidylyltransferase
MHTTVTAIITPTPSERQDGAGAVPGLPSFLDGTQQLIHGCQACGMHVVLVGTPGLLAEAATWDLAGPVQLTQLADPHPAHRLSSALRAGVLVSAQSAAWVLLPSGLTPPRLQTLEHLRRALAQHLLIYPSHKGRIGMPMGFGQELFSELIRLTTDRELLRLVNRYPAQALELDDPALLMQAWDLLFSQVTLFSPHASPPPILRS